MSLTELINKSIANPFRRAYIKRRQTSDGKYESNWQNITQYVKKWGNIKTSVDEIKLNTFKQSGISIKVVNDEGKFNIETNESSLWYNYMTRFRTLLKIEAGYNDSAGLEYPRVFSNEDMVVFYKCDDNNATLIATDFAGNIDGRTKTSTSALSVPGVFNNAFLLNTSTSNLNFDGAYNFITTGAFSFAMWFKTDAPTNTTQQLVNMKGISQPYMLLNTGGTGQYAMALSGTNIRYWSNDIDVLDGDWHHICFTIPGQDTTSIADSVLYVDGTAMSVNTTTTSGTTTAINTVTVCWTAKAYIDNFVLFHKELTKAEVISLYESTLGYPTKSGADQGIFILTDDVKISAKTNDATMNFKSLTSIFDEVSATDVTGLNSTQTAFDIIEKIRDHTDGSGEYVFRQFITSTNWTIQTTTNNYLLDTATNIDGMSCWELMNKLAEAEGYILLINRFGGIEFRDRDERTTTSQFSFYGQGFKDQNIISLDEVREPITKFYNYIRLKYLEPDTSSSYVTAGTATAVDPSLSSWKFGVRTYEFENTFIANSNTAQTIASTLLSLYENNINEELKLKTKFCPQLEVSDKILLNYRSYVLQNVMIWDVADWATDAAYLPEDAEWADEKGENFDWTDIPFKILSRQTNLDNFSNVFVIKRLL